MIRRRWDICIWSAWSSNYAVPEFMQGTGRTRFSPVKPQQWVALGELRWRMPAGDCLRERIW